MAESQRGERINRPEWVSSAEVYLAHLCFLSKSHYLHEKMLKRRFPLQELPERISEGVVAVRTFNQYIGEIRVNGVVVPTTSIFYNPSGLQYIDGEFMTAEEYQKFYPNDKEERDVKSHNQEISRGHGDYSDILYSHPFSLEKFKDIVSIGKDEFIKFFPAATTTQFDQVLEALQDPTYNPLVVRTRTNSWQPFLEGDSIVYLADLLHG